jgi:hypothetical protein
MMSRRTLHLSLIVLSIILLNGLAFAGNAQETLGGALPGNTANHPQPMTAEKVVMTNDQKAAPAAAAATQQKGDAAMQNDKQTAPVPSPQGE